MGISQTETTVPLRGDIKEGRLRCGLSRLRSKLKIAFGSWIKLYNLWISVIARWWDCYIPSITAPEKHEGTNFPHMASKAALAVPMNSHPRKLFHVAIWPPQRSMKGFISSDAWEPARHIILQPTQRRGSTWLTLLHCSLYPLLTLLRKYFFSVFPNNFA